MINGKNKHIGYYDEKEQAIVQLNFKRQEEAGRTKTRKRNLSIKKQLQEHLIIKKYLNEAPDFKGLAKEIISKRSKSKVGVEDEKKLLLKLQH